MNKSLTFLLALLAFMPTVFSQKNNITIDDIWASPKFAAKEIDELKSSADGEKYTSVKYAFRGPVIVEYTYSLGLPLDTLVTGTNAFSIDYYEISPDESKVLYTTASEKIYRHSSVAKANIWFKNNKTSMPLMSGERVMYPTLSPDGNSAAFVYKGDLYMQNISTQKITRITNDGSDVIFNGVSDWVYEEEFVVTRAYAWSPDSKSIAFYRFDDSKVPEFSMNEYHDSLYPTVYKFRYPKAGANNPTVAIKIYHVDGGNITGVNPPGKFEYIPRIKWTLSSSQLSIQFMNRHQDSLVFVLADANSGQTSPVFTETSKTYIDVYDALTFINGNKEFIWESDKDGYVHIYRYSIKGNLINQITKGKWDVMEFKGIDEKTGIVYFVSSATSPIDRDLMSVKLDGNNMKNLSFKKGFNSADFSSNFHYYINNFSDVNTPNISTLCSSDGKQLRVLEDNKELNNVLATYDLGKKKFFSFTTSSGTVLNGWMITPPDFDSTKKYPVLMTVYGGPGINTVNNSYDGYNGMWDQMLAEKGYIIASVDNRGTGARGSEFQKCTYLTLGKLETEDQIEGAKYLGSRPYIDATRIGIWGWSYGGFMAANCITKGADYFKTAISVAPVTDWEFYDSIYTERYMRTPAENEAGYHDNSPIYFADKLKGHYLLVHGTGDDNVHFQNSIEWIHALEKAEKPFSLMIFPDKNHGIYGGNTRHYLYTQMTDFVTNNL